MTSERIITLIIGSVVTGLIGLGFIAVKAMLDRMVKQFDAWFQEMKLAQAEIRSDFNAFRLEAAQNYATQIQLEKAERENHSSHATIHARLDNLHADLVRIDTVQRHCKHCRGIDSGD